MKRIIVVLLSVFVLCSCSKKLNIEVKDTQTRGASASPDYYTIENKSGAELKNVTFTINDSYFYIVDIPEGGMHLELEEFTTKDGRRFDIYKIKPLVLTAKSKAGTYSVNFSDISFEPEPDIVKMNGKEVKRYVINDSAILEPMTIQTADGGTVYIKLFFTAYDGKSATEISKNKEIIEKMRKILESKSIPDFYPKNEDNLSFELSEVADKKIDVRFAELEYNE